jgi:hypothetical protein
MPFVAGPKYQLLGMNGNIACGSKYISNSDCTIDIFILVSLLAV